MINDRLKFAGEAYKQEDDRSAREQEVVEGDFVYSLDNMSLSLGGEGYLVQASYTLAVVLVFRPEGLFAPAKQRKI